MNKPTYTDYLKMAPEEQASHAGHFAALNETPALDLEAQWHRDGWTVCKECDGDGFYEYDTGNPNTYEEHHECEECMGSGQVKMSYMDFLFSLEDEQ